MITVWIAFYLAHYLDMSAVDWYASPFILTSIVAALAEFFFVVRFLEKKILGTNAL